MNKQKTPSRRRLWMLIALAVLVTGGVCWYIEYYLSRSIGKGPAGPVVDRSAFGAVWSDRRVHVVGIGDSITAGLGAESTSHTFFNRILDNPPDEYSELHGVCLRAVLPNVSAGEISRSLAQNPRRISRSFVHLWR